MKTFYVMFKNNRGSVGFDFKASNQSEAFKKAHQWSRQHSHLKIIGIAERLPRRNKNV